MQPDNYDPAHEADLRAEYVRNLAGDICPDDYEYEVAPGWEGSDWDDYDWGDYDWDDYGWVDPDIEEDE